MSLKLGFTLVILVIVLAVVVNGGIIIGLHALGASWLLAVLADLFLVALSQIATAIQNKR